MSLEGDESQPLPRANRSPRRWSAAAGAVIGLAGAALVARALYQERDEIAQAWSNAKPALLLVAFVFVGFAMTGIGLAWRSWLRALGGTLDVARALRGYFVGQLGKYLPGGVWAIMGRAEWARSEGIPARIAYSSVFLSIGSAFLAAVMLAAIVLPISDLTSSAGDRRYLLVLLLLPIGFGLLHPRALEAVLGLLRRTTGRELDIEVPSWATSSGIVVQQLPSWFLIGTASWVIGNAFGSRGDLANILVAVAISWVIGFLALPVPGGLGVREAAFVALATSLPTGIAAAVAVAARLVTIAVDTVGAASASAFVARRDHESERQ